MRILLDEDTPVQLVEVLRHLLPKHRIDHIRELRWAGKKDRAVLADARKAGFDVLLTNDARQLDDPDETDAIKKFGLNHIRYSQRHPGLKGLALSMGAVISSMPTIVEDLDAASGQRLVQIQGLELRGRYARATTWQELVDGRWQTPRASMLDPFKPYLHQRVEEGCGNFVQLFREISSRGYTGSYSTVRDYLEQHRPAKTPLASPAPTVREVTGWLTRHPDSLTEDEWLRRKALAERCPELAAATYHVCTFGMMLTQLTGQDLLQWISDVKAARLPGLSPFAKGLEQDLDAVTTGMTTRWNSGPVEGRVNHIKMIKRQMFGEPACRCSANGSCSPPRTDDRRTAAARRSAYRSLLMGFVHGLRFDLVEEGDPL